MSLKKRDKKNRPPLSPTSKCVVGVTGGIGSGKSFVLTLLKSYGFEVHQTDIIAKRLMRREGAAFKQISKLFPDAVIKSGISLSKLKKIAFTDKTVFPKLGEILHPLVRVMQQELIDKRKKSIVFEVPLLFENKREAYYDYIIAAVTSVKTQKNRAMLRKGMTISKLDVILSKQSTNKHRKAKADFIINTSGTKESTKSSLRKIINVPTKRDST